MTDSAEEQRLLRRKEMFAERVASHDTKLDGYAAVWSEFEAALLTFGGVAAVPPMSPDPMLKIFIAEGFLQDPRSVVVVVGDPSRCHQNAAALWRSRKALSIGTGYGLTGDLWREHSWGVDSESRLIETTEVRDQYFGIVISGERAQKFADWVSPPGTTN